MALESTNDTVAILYDIENAPIEMLQFTIEQAKRYMPCRVIVISDWEAHPEQKRWDKLMEYPDFTFRQINRTYEGKNSLDSALYDSAQILYKEGVRKYFIITTDSDFINIAKLLNSVDKSYIIGIGTQQASRYLRKAYDEFLVFKLKATKTKTKSSTQNKSRNKVLKEGNTAMQKTTGNKKTAESKATAADSKRKTKTQANKSNNKKDNLQSNLKEANNSSTEILGITNGANTGNLVVRIPKTLKNKLDSRMNEEGVSMDELITFLIMQGLAKE